MSAPIPTRSVKLSQSPCAADSSESAHRVPFRIPERLYGIVGHPLGHTLSPLLHNWGFALHSLPAVYMAWPVPPGRFASFMEAVRTLPVHGASVTIPHKEEALRLCDRVTDRARAVGAVNTLFLEDGVVCGENTDVTGFLAPLRARGVRIDEALVLGAGGAARAVLAGLVELGVRRVRISNRTHDKAMELAGAFGADVVPWDERGSAAAGLVVNTTPCGMQGARMGESPLPDGAFTGRGMAYDLVYNPLTTRFLADARAAGWETQDGLGMFVEQGREQFRIWTGLDLPAAGARRLIAEALGL